MVVVIIYIAVIHAGIILTPVLISDVKLLPLVLARSCQRLMVILLILIFKLLAVVVVLE